jgi:hypothetical protein
MADSSVLLFKKEPLISPEISYGKVFLRTLNNAGNT